MLEQNCPKCDVHVKLHSIQPVPLQTLIWAFPRTSSSASVFAITFSALNAAAKHIFSLGVRPIGGFGFFTKTFDIGFRLIWCLVDVLADLGNALVLSRRLYVDDETRSVGSADDPPIRESRITSGDEKNGCQKNPMQH